MMPARNLAESTKEANTRDCSRRSYFLHRQREEEDFLFTMITLQCTRIRTRVQISSPSVLKQSSSHN